MKIYVTTKFIIIGITIIVIIFINDNYIWTMNPPGWHPTRVNNTGTLYLGDEHCLVRNSVGVVFVSLSICPCLLTF